MLHGMTLLGQAVKAYIVHNFKSLNTTITATLLNQCAIQGIRISDRYTISSVQPDHVYKLSFKTDTNGHITSSTMTQIDDQPELHNLTMCIRVKYQLTQLDLKHISLKQNEQLTEDA